MHTDVSIVRQLGLRLSRRLGLLADPPADFHRPPGEARVLLEVGPDGAREAELRDRLGLDAEGLHRLLAPLAGEGLVDLAPDPADRRVRTVRLTGPGRCARQDLERRLDERAARLLAALTAEQRARLVDALSTADRLLRAATIELRTVDPLAPDAVRAVRAYFAELDERFPGGFDPGDAPEGDAPHYRAPRGSFVVAYADGRAVGCGGVTTLAPGVGEIKRMWVAEDVRGIGLGRRLLAHLEALSAGLGHAVVRLDTNGVLQAALAMYRSAGYVEIAPYNANPYARHWFEKRLA